ncbi:hypothetical protein SLEP1_g18040 [Rubroshorea leprosula]|uniref:Uncharacterized protein n=1 Tax=Rubroshorea leprosula TaxID=152421 RepID=A0AAV5IW79_9ROSI|nr:hypothetical protein SLEP1_g18040 [Rubroshorea leprosula]
MILILHSAIHPEFHRFFLLLPCSSSTEKCRVFFLCLTDDV